MPVYFASSFIKLDTKVARTSETCGLNKAGNITWVCWLQLKLACSLGQVRDVSGLVGFSCKLGWPQQLYTQDKDGEWHTQGTDTRTSCPGSMLRSPTRKTLVYTHRGSSVNCRLGDFTSHFSYKISLHRTLRDKKRMQWGTQTNRWKKWQVNVLKKVKTWQKKPAQILNQIAFWKKSYFL